MGSIHGAGGGGGSTAINAEGTPGSASPSKTLQVGGSDGTNLRTAKVNADGQLSVNLEAGSARASAADPIDASGNTITLKFARINATSDGVNTATVAGVPGKKIRVIGYAFTNGSTAGTVTIQDDAGTPNVLAVFDLAVRGGAVYAGSPQCPAFETATGEGLTFNNAAGVDITGHLTYIEV